jgi:hypothetical protein
VAAGSTNTQAGAFSPFTVTLRRPDGDQALSSVTAHLPPGAAAMLTHVTPCSEPPPGVPWSCGPESRIGESTASSGLGGDPFTLTGTVYLTQGYDGAPFGALDATLVQAGPFHLGWVYVRQRINVDPSTAAATITTDPGPHDDALPTMLKGVPVQLKQINVNINRPEFELNPTNCNPMEATGVLGGDEGASASTSSPFGVTNCAALRFKPVLTAAATGEGSRTNGVAFKIAISSPGLGQGNLKKVDLTIPEVLPARLTTLQKACPEATFNANPASCDPDSVVGTTTVQTPLLKHPLVGPNYIVSHGGAAFPNVEVVLQSEGIKVVVTGTTYIHNGITYSKFDATPDAPFTRFETELPRGPDSIFAAYAGGKEPYDLCGHKVLIPTEITAQDGAVIKQSTKVTLLGCKAVASYKSTRAAKLARALKKCKHYRNARRRATCEKAARKKYGHSKAAKGSTHAAK